MTFSLGVVAPEKRRDEMVQAFRSVLGPTRAAPGCLRCKLFEDLQEPQELRLLVEWKSREDFERHVRTDVFQRILQSIELAAEPPELEIGTIASVRGMDLLREILECEDDGP